jgi:hypothetical protein
VASNACRWSFCSGTVDHEVGTPAAQGGAVGLGEVARVLRKGWPATNGQRRWPLGGVHRRPTAACRGTVGNSPYSRRLLLFASKQGPCIYPAVRRPPSTCVRRDRRRTARRAAAVRHGTRSHATGSRSQATGAKGSRLLVPRGGGTWPARMPRRRDVQRAAQGR